MVADANVPLIFKGQLCVSPDGVTYTDVSDEITNAQLHFSADEISIPATAGQPKSTRKGGAMASLEIGFLSTDGTGGTLYPLLWTAAATATKTLFFRLLYRDGAKGATNPRWTGSFIVSGASLGGDAETLSQDSRTFPLTALPTFDEA